MWADVIGFRQVYVVSRRLGNAAHIHGLCQRLRRTCSCADLAHVGAHCSNLEALDLTDALEFNGRCAPWSTAVEVEMLRLAVHASMHLSCWLFHNYPSGPLHLRALL